MADATCAWCGSTFTRRRSDQRCCDKVCGKKYANNVKRRKHQCTCRVCGTEWVATKPSQVCSSKCLGVEHARRIAGREPNPLRNDSPRRRMARRKLERAAKGTSATRSMVAGPCVECGTTYVHTRATGGKRPLFCSAKCGRKVAERNRRALKKAAFRAPVYKRRVFERDRWVCQLCGKPTRPDKRATLGTKRPHPLAPVVDHIIPLGDSGTHEPSNAQCAHFLCNSLKSDKVIGPGEQLRLLVEA